MTRYRVVNMAWQLPGDAKLLHTVASTADVLGIVEARDFHNNPVDVATILGQDWQVWQDTSDGARAGTAVAVRRTASARARRKAQQVSEFLQVASGNGNVQARFMRKLKLKDGRRRLTLFVVHNPTLDSGKQDEAVRKVAQSWRLTPGRKLLLADCNMEPLVFAARIGAPHYSGSKPMVIAWSKGWDGARANWVATTGSDHKVGTFRATA